MKAGLLAGRRAGGAFDPTSITDLEAWYDASDTATITDTAGAVDQWNDKSGNGHHMTASGSNRPTTNAATFNSHNIVQFSNNVMAVANADTSFADLGLSTYAVFRKTGANNSIEAAPVLMTVSNTGRVFDRYSSSVFGHPWVIGSTSTTGFADIRSQTTMCQFAWIGDRDNPSTGTHTLAEYKNGTLTNSGTNTATWAFASNIQLGKRADGNTAFRGDLCEALIYGVTHDTTTRQSIEAYLADKWGL